MVGKSQIKLIKSLHQKKYRNQHGLFIVEGNKAVMELLNSDLDPYGIYTTDKNVQVSDLIDVQLISENELKQISALKTPNKLVGVFNIPQPRAVNFDDWILVLDDVRDPGNLGTIIRLCDWFGISNLVCSESTVDCYNPKVIQATMGSITRVNTVYTNLNTFIEMAEVPVYGTFMSGENVYKSELPAKGILVMGNEANGISKELTMEIQNQISIPKYGEQSTESLNVATATAVFLSEIRRR